MSRKEPFAPPSGMMMNYMTENIDCYIKWGFKVSLDHTNEIGVLKIIVSILILFTVTNREMFKNLIKRSCVFIKILSHTYNHYTWMMVLQHVVKNKKNLRFSRKFNGYYKSPDLLTILTQMVHVLRAFGSLHHFQLLVWMKHEEHLWKSDQCLNDWMPSL